MSPNSKSHIKLGSYMSQVLGQAKETTADSEINCHNRRKNTTPPAIKISQAAGKIFVFIPSITRTESRTHILNRTSAKTVFHKQRQSFDSCPTPPFGSRVCALSNSNPEWFFRVHRPLQRLHKQKTHCKILQQHCHIQRQISDTVLNLQILGVESIRNIGLFSVFPIQ